MHVMGSKDKLHYEKLSEIPTQNFDHVHQHGSRRREERPYTRNNRRDANTTFSGVNLLIEV